MPPPDGRPVQAGPLPSPGRIAAERSPAAGGRRPRPQGRAYPAVVAAEDHAALCAQLAATRALLVADSPAQVAAVVATLVHDLGGGLVPARIADPEHALPLDVALGVTEPLLPSADPVSLAAMRLGALLPAVLEDARAVLGRLLADARRDDPSGRDVLTGLLTRRAWVRRLSLARPGDGVCVLDLDGGDHDVDEEAVRSLGALLLRSSRVVDACGREGDDRLVCLTPGLAADALAQRCQQVVRAWEAQDGAGRLRVGVAEVGAEGGRAALRVADRALREGCDAARQRAGPDGEQRPWS